MSIGPVHGVPQNSEPYDSRGVGEKDKVLIAEPRDLNLDVRKPDFNNIKGNNPISNLYNGNNLLEKASLLIS